MKNIFLISAIIFSSIAYGQFKIDGHINHFPNRDVIVKIYTGSSERVINKFKTDDTGKFSVNIPQSYSGLVVLENKKSGAVLEILTDNEDVVFNSDFQQGNFKNIVFTKGKTAQGYDEYRKYDKFNKLKNQLFPNLKGQYNSDDEFYKAIEKEEVRIAFMEPDNSVPLVKYNSQVVELSKAQAESEAAAEVYKNKILGRLIKDGDQLEGTGMMPQLVMNYLRFSLIGKSTPEEVNASLENTIDDLLAQTDLETPRGQNVLTSIFTVLPATQFQSLLEKYYDKANALTCEITDDLKASLFSHNNTQPGTVVPNIVFAEPVKGFNSLYDVKAEKKIIIFWASWCPACMQEMPYVQAFYENFKKEGGEIVAISIDVDESEFLEATKHFGWINYTELAKWDTQGIKEFGVGSTPSLFLVDKDNKLIKMATHISELFD